MNEFVNNYYLEILKYLSPSQLDELYYRNLNSDINLAILQLKRNKLIQLLNVTEEQIKVIQEIKILEKKEQKITPNNSSTNQKIDESKIYETKDSLEACQYTVHGFTVTYDEERKIYLIKDNKN